MVHETTKHKANTNTEPGAIATWSGDDTNKQNKQSDSICDEIQMHQGKHNYGTDNISNRICGEIDKLTARISTPKLAQTKGAVYPAPDRVATAPGPVFVHPLRLLPSFLRPLIFAAACMAALAVPVAAQDPRSAEQKADAAKKANARPVEKTDDAPEPFDGATVEKMAAHCVSLETELGAIEIEMIPEAAPESVRSFLNLAATGALDTTNFSRVVKDFVIQGGNLSTSEKWGHELAKRMSRKLPDEPGLVKHVRGIVSMARPAEANSATTSFFILVGSGQHLDGKFSAFGRVTTGIEVADAINKAPVEGEKPNKPVRINRAAVAPCKK